MTKEEKKIIKKELCNRLFYSVKCRIYNNERNIKGYGKRYFDTTLTVDNIFQILNDPLSDYEEVKPFLRPMSNMTEEERNEYNELREDIEAKLKDWKCADFMEWIYLHNLDYRGLIEKGLALEAPEGMYNI